jgi:RsiW-degrading membrane proteinase PrsW (M82 family)
MSPWILFSGILAPALFWASYFYAKDRFQPEPLTRIGTAYLLGIGSALLCVQALRVLPFLHLPYDPSGWMEGNRLRFLLYSVGITGLAEEFFKFLPFRIFVLRFRCFDEKTDGILYASFIALGFSSLENILYLPHLSGLELFGRAFASPLTHTIFSSIWGYTVGVAHISGGSRGKAAALGLGLAALSHGLFNFFTTSASLRIGASLLILGIWVWRIRILEAARPRPDARGG